MQDVPGGSGPADDAVLDLDAAPPAPRSPHRRARRVGARLAGVVAVAFAAGVGAAELVERSAAEARDATAVSVVVLPAAQWSYQDPYADEGSPRRAPDHAEGTVMVHVVNAGPRPLVLRELHASGRDYEILATNRDLALPPLGSLGVLATFTVRCVDRPLPTQVPLTLRVRTAEGVDRTVERSFDLGTYLADVAGTSCATG